ncbi:zinc-ribbon domain-containing protein [uncultured Methanobrevibacter sp.]|uniref:zinc-ribbon domain-containing protein n=1 Tax=uncultured Methanobrevibacter sp. TaxID=253161 RepID=UPI0026257AD4|nr:zinc ribbon domain-containing protein [uncultured Methanobrevibacter sp.]
MSKFCPNCGEELVENARFCKKCGYDLENKKENDFAPASGQYTPQVAEKSHTIAIVIGYIAAILVPIIGLIIGVYLMTRDEEKAKRHGKYVIIVAIVVWILNFIFIMR